MAWKLEPFRVYINSNYYILDTFEYVEVERPYDEITSAYFNFIEALTKTKDFYRPEKCIVYSPLRIIDEIERTIMALNPTFIKAVNRHIIPYFIDIQFKKITPEEIIKQQEEAKINLKKTTSEPLRRLSNNERINRVKSFRKNFKR